MGERISEESSLGRVDFRGEFSEESGSPGRFLEAPFLGKRYVCEILNTLNYSVFSIALIDGERNDHVHICPHDVSSYMVSSYIMCPSIWCYCQILRWCVIVTRLIWKTQ
jgi:hypothetical protein